MSGDRHCGSCSMCCKVMRIEELSKPKLTWCHHCNVGKGCAIYESKPRECTDFQCLWLMNESLEDKYKPDKLKIVLYPHMHGYILADCDQRGSLSEPRNMSMFLELAAFIERMGSCLIVCYGNYMKAVTTRGTFDLGQTRETHNVVLTKDYSGSIVRVSVAPFGQVSV